MSRGWKIAWAISLSLNLLLVGFIGARLWLRPHFGSPMMGPMAMHSLMRDLPEARRRELEPHWRATLQELRPAMGEVRVAQAEVAKAIAAEPFSEAALRRALTSVYERMNQSQSGLDDAFVGLVSKLNAEERRQFADAMERRSAHRRGHHRQAPN